MPVEGSASGITAIGFRRSVPPSPVWNELGWNPMAQKAFVSFWSEFPNRMLMVLPWTGSPSVVRTGTPYRPGQPKPYSSARLRQRSKTSFLSPLSSSPR